MTWQHLCEYQYFPVMSLLSSYLLSSGVQQSTAPSLLAEGNRPLIKAPSPTTLLGTYGAFFAFVLPPISVLQNILTLYNSFLEMAPYYYEQKVKWLSRRTRKEMLSLTFRAAAVRKDGSDPAVFFFSSNKVIICLSGQVLAFCCTQN